MVRRSWSKTRIMRRKEALAVLAEGMRDKRRRRETDRVEKEAELHEQIGKLTMQVEWFKKKLGVCPSGNDGR
jgi:hypothetical protein